MVRDSESRRSRRIPRRVDVAKFAKNFGRSVRFEEGKPQEAQTNTNQLRKTPNNLVHQPIPRFVAFGAPGEAWLIYSNERS